MRRRTIDASNNPSVLGGARAKNNGRYNGNGRRWATPPEIFDPLHLEFGFTIDVCATSETAKVPRFYAEPIPASGGEGCLAFDGLVQSWREEIAWMNNPYGAEIYAWTRKARIEASGGATVVGLLPNSSDLRWWHEDVEGHAEIRHIRGRVRFLTGGPYRASGFFPSVIVIWRPPGIAVPAKEWTRDAR